MADWYGTCRSNYFKVKDAEAFLEFMKRFPASVHKGDGEKEENVFCFISDDFHGAVPVYYDEDTDDEHNIIDEIWTYLAEGEVIIIQEIGAEKARYLTGKSWAINWKGEAKFVSIDDIYEIAKELQLVRVSGEISTATY